MVRMAENHTMKDYLWMQSGLIIKVNDEDAAQSKFMRCP